jgi:hypothetical protein
MRNSPRDIVPILIRPQSVPGLGGFPFHRKQRGTYFLHRDHLDKTPTEFGLADSKFMDGLAVLAKTLLKNKFLCPEFVFPSRTESCMYNLLPILKAGAATTQITRQSSIPPTSRFQNGLRFGTSFDLTLKSSHSMF